MRTTRLVFLAAVLAFAALAFAALADVAPRPRLPEGVSVDAKERLVGKHNLSLQWLSFEHPFGTLTVEEKDGKLHGSGEQRGKGGDRLTVTGVIVGADARSIVLDGTVEYAVRTITGAKPCTKTGKLWFRASGTRKYWRLQDMASCEGGTTDYVDIYFLGEPPAAPAR